MSAAEVFAVATPSWKRKGFRCAKDLDASEAIIDDSDDLVAASFLVVLFVLRRIPRPMLLLGERWTSQLSDDVLVLNITRLESIDVASILYSSRDERLG